jgi:hypothetical protein
MFASAKQIDGTDGWRWRLRQVRNILFGKKKGGYGADGPSMASYGNGVSQRRPVVGPNLDIELRSPTMDVEVTPYPFAKPIHHPTMKSKPFPSTMHRLDNLSPTRGRGQRSPTRGHSDERSPTIEHHSDGHTPPGRYRSDDRFARRNRSDDRSRTRDKRSPTIEHRSEKHSPSTSHPPSSKDRWYDRFDDLGNSLSRYPGKSGGASLHFLAPPPSYPSHNEHSRTSLSRY